MIRGAESDQRGGCPHHIGPDAVEYSLHIGCIGPAESDDVLQVDVVQHEEFDQTGLMPTGPPEPMEVRVAGVRLTARQARDLARLLTAAANIVDNAADRRAADWGEGAE
jgi:hypothetical protein